MAKSSSDEEQPDQPIDFATAKVKITRYCAYQERCHREVSHKLYSYGLFKEDVDNLIAWLITENYLNEERYARSFAGGKFRIKKWGRIKIRQYLQQNKVSEYSINKALAEIDEDRYIECLKEIITKQGLLKTASNIYEHRNKIARYAISRGFEPDLVWDHTKTILV